MQHFSTPKYIHLPTEAKDHGHPTPFTYTNNTEQNKMLNNTILGAAVFYHQMTVQQLNPSTQHVATCKNLQISELESLQLK